MKHELISILCATIITWQGGTAAAQTQGQQAQNCAPRDSVVERLAKKWGESRKAMGLGNNNSVVEVFASDETGTWTITVTTAGGTTCLIAAGEWFEELSEVLPSSFEDA